MPEPNVSPNPAVPIKPLDPNATWGQTILHGLGQGLVSLGYITMTPEQREGELAKAKLVQQQKEFEQEQTLRTREQGVRERQVGVSEKEAETQSKQQQATQEYQTGELGARQKQLEFEKQKFAEETFNKHLEWRMQGLLTDDAMKSLETSDPDMYKRLQAVPIPPSPTTPVLEKTTGEPYGLHTKVKGVEKDIFPGSAEWTPDHQKLLDAVHSAWLPSHQRALQEKIKESSAVAGAQETARETAKPVTVFDPEIQSMRDVPEGEVQKNPKLQRIPATLVSTVSGNLQKLNNVTRVLENLRQHAPLFDSLTAAQRTIMGRASNTMASEGGLSETLTATLKKSLPQNALDYLADLDTAREEMTTIRQASGGGTRGAQQQVRQAIKALGGEDVANSKEFNRRLDNQLANAKGLTPALTFGISPKGQEGASGGKIRARDEKGQLHEAPAGTALPKGWKLEQ